MQAWAASARSIHPEDANPYTLKVVLTPNPCGWFLTGGVGFAPRRFRRLERLLSPRTPLLLLMPPALPLV